MRRRIRIFCALSAALLATVAGAAHSPGRESQQRPRTAVKTPEEDSFQSLDDILRYISGDWDTLSRSLLKCTTYEDVKTSGEPVLYLPAGIEEPPAVAEMQKHCHVRVLRLPARGTNSPTGFGEIHPHGLLYLENPYVVPGGQFNEMYGWDSYFIIRGLLRDGRMDLAKGMVENFFFEIDHYAGVLNANRTYYLGRSQPPFLTSMILAVYDAEKAAGREDRAWLEKAHRYAVQDYEQWNHEPHLAGDTGLSRYYDEGEGPVPEISGGSSNYYRGVLHYFLVNEGENSPRLSQLGAKQSASPPAGSIYEITVCDPKTSARKSSNCDPADRVALSADFYKGDRAMRESGFDVSFRFKPYGADTHKYAPVCLNSLLYKTEKDLEEISRVLNRPDDAAGWKRKADERRDWILKYLWDESRGQFFDYNFTTHARSTYQYATTFYPLWTGLATPGQARAVDANLKVFEQPGGIAMSTFESDAQWDYPYGWAPLQLLAVEGLRRYGYRDDAERISFNFLVMILQNFRRDHTMREKYNVVTRSSETHVTAGYKQNAAGFGWTNGVFLELVNDLPPQLLARLKKQ